jgi:hypothetical protein
MGSVQVLEDFRSLALHHVWSMLIEPGLRVRNADDRAVKSLMNANMQYKAIQNARRIEDIRFALLNAMVMPFRRS